MTSADKLKYLKERVSPLFNEVGIEGFTMFGYVRLPDGKLQRFCIFDDHGDAAQQDGLRPALNFSQMWGAHPSTFAPGNAGPQHPDGE